MVGVVEEGLFFYLGPDADSLELADRVESSVVQNESCEFWTDFAGKEILWMSFVNEGMIDALEIFSEPTEFWSLAGKALEESGKELKHQDAIRERLAVLDQLEEIKEERETSDYVSVAYLDEGFYFESQGGAWKKNDPAQDPWEMIPDVVLNPLMQVHYRVDEEERLRELTYVEESAELLVLLFDEWLGKMGDDAEGFLQSVKELGEFQSMRSEFLSIYRAWRDDILAGIGPERLWMMDLEGRTPPDAGMPEGRLPRLSFVAPVRARDKLSVGFIKTENALKRLSGKVEEKTGGDLGWPEKASGSRDEWDFYQYQVPSGGEVAHPMLAWNREYFLRQLRGRRDIRWWSICNQAEGQAMVFCLSWIWAS